MTAKRIRRRHWETVQEQSLEADATLDVNRREPINLEAEGADLDALEATFARTAADPDASTDSEAVASDTETRPAETDSLEEQSLEAELLARLDAIADLLGAIAVFRQYFKTIALHQELAQLSRQFIFVGFPAIVVAVLVPLLHKTNPAEVLTSYPLAPILSASLAIVLTPLVLVLVYMLRIATIFRYTVSVAPFTPPVEWPWTDHPE